MPAVEKCRKVLWITKVFNDMWRCGGRCEDDKRLEFTQLFDQYSAPQSQVDVKIDMKKDDAVIK